MATKVTYLPQNFTLRDPFDLVHSLNLEISKTDVINVLALLINDLHVILRILLDHY